MRNKTPSVLALNTAVDACEIKEILHSDGFCHRYFAWDESLSVWVVLLEFFPDAQVRRGPDGIACLPLPDQQSAFHHALLDFIDLGEALARHASVGLEHVLTVIRQNGTAYWLIEPVQGVSLADFLRNHPEPLREREIIRLAHHLLVALAALHREHLYHLALAPEQIYLASVDAPVVCGVAHARYLHAERSDELESFVLPVFAAPELGQPGGAGPLADLYSLGACLYFAMTRRLLPVGEGSAAAPFTHTERQHYSSGLMEIVIRLTQARPEERFQSVLEALQALARLTAQEVRKQQPTERYEHHPAGLALSVAYPQLRTVLTLLLLLTVLGAGIWFKREQEPVRGSELPSLALPERTRPAPPEVAPELLRAAPVKPVSLPARRVYQFNDALKDGGTGPSMVVVPQGVFTMGDADGVGQSSEAPLQRIRLSRDFAMGRYEVTFEDYDRYAEATGRPKPRDEGWGRGPRPVINVSFNDAQAYVQWLAEQTGRPYRLASEAEWEYAARAGAKGLHAWGETVGKGNAVCDGCGSSYDFAKTAPAGSFAPNRFGLHDMQGNVAEWVQDCWSADLSEVPGDGSPRLSGNCGFRIWRGGSWADLPRALRLSVRTSYPRDYRSNKAGIRLALDL